MRNKNAKAFRRHVYGDYSLKERKYVRKPNRQIVATGRRAKYQQFKREWKADRRKGKKR